VLLLMRQRPAVTEELWHVFEAIPPAHVPTILSSIVCLTASHPAKGRINARPGSQPTIDADAG